jgi:hypothetical protein
LGVVEEEFNVTGEELDVVEELRVVEEEFDVVKEELDVVSADESKHPAENRNALSKIMSRIPITADFFIKNSYNFL